MTHSKKVSSLQKQIQEAQEMLGLKKRSSNTLRAPCANRATRVDLCSFKEILEITSDYVICEPRITIRDLVRTTLKQGFVPAVVPEFCSITVGGALMGAALESSSHKWGQFSDICLEVELILGDGTLVKASPSENADLFYGLSGSYGTLAILTAIKIKLIPAKSHVLIRYTRHKPTELIQKFSDTNEKDFWDGIVLRKDLAIEMQGEMVDASKKYPTFRQKRASAPWFYQHLEKAPPEELMPLEDYLFRLDRGAFWMGRFLLSFPLMMQLAAQYKLPTLASRVRRFSKNLSPDKHPSFLFRLLFGRFLTSEGLYHYWHKTPKEILENIFLVHDYYTPLEKADEALDYFMKRAQIFPIWLCPIKGTQTPQLLSPHFGQKRFVNIGLYGAPQENPLALSKEFEEAIVEFGGRKMLYSYGYYDRPTFARIFPMEEFERLRKKYHADKRFEQLYNKVVGV